jgi:putative transposase
VSVRQVWTAAGHLHRRLGVAPASPERRLGPALAGEVAAGQGWPPPSYSRVYAIVASMDPALVTLAHDGGKRYREVFDLVRRRTAERPNAIWQADHTQLDLTTLDPTGVAGTAVADGDHGRANSCNNPEPTASPRHRVDAVG